MQNCLAAKLTDQIWHTLGGAREQLASLRFTSSGEIASAFPVTDLAAASIAAAGLAAAELAGDRQITVDRRHAIFWFGWSLRPQGWQRPAERDPVTGDYPTQDGWIRLHANAPHHRRAIELVLGTGAPAAVVAGWNGRKLEEAIVSAGGCAAEMRSAAAWARHAQGIAIAAEPLIHLARAGQRDRSWQPAPGRPLAGLRVLDLTRVLAGPVATRFLAGYGAEVLRIDPFWWEEPGVAPEVTLGKACARLDLGSPAGRQRLAELLASADILVHGYRPGALDRLGFDADARQRLSPGLIDIALDAYGWTGPWAGRRGFDLLVQMSAGIAAAGLAWRQANRPVPLPVQALDHATGYLAAAAAIRGVTLRRRDGGGTQARLSLARTAKLLTDAPRSAQHALMPETQADLAPGYEATEWGLARRLRAPLTIDGNPLHWEVPAHALGSDPPRWRAAAA